MCRSHPHQIISSLICILPSMSFSSQRPVIPWMHPTISVMVIFVSSHCAIQGSSHLVVPITSPTTGFSGNALPNLSPSCAPHYYHSTSLPQNHCLGKSSMLHHSPFPTLIWSQMEVTVMALVPDSHSPWLYIVSEIIWLKIVSPILL